MRALFLFLFSILALSGAANAAESATPEVRLTMKDTGFEPARIEIPANSKIKLIVNNAMTKPAEFESNDFKREKIIAAGQTAKIAVGPLPAGEYKFFDEFNEKNTGTLVVK